MSYNCQTVFRGVGGSQICHRPLGHGGDCAVVGRPQHTDWGQTFKHLMDEGQRRFRCANAADLKAALHWARPGDTISVTSGTTLTNIPSGVQIIVNESN